MSRVADESTKRRITTATSPDQLLAKEAKQLKKDKAKEEEARRLKVIVSTAFSVVVLRLT